MLTFKQSVPMAVLALKKISLQINLCCFLLFVFKLVFIGFSSLTWVAAQSPSFAASMKAGVGRSNRNRGRGSLFSTSTDFHQSELAVNLFSVVDGVN